MMMSKCGKTPRDYKKQYLILGEGTTEQNFFYHLLKKNNLLDNYTTDYAGGFDNLVNYLESIKNSEDFIDNVKAVLLVADNDDINGSNRFDILQSRLRNTNCWGIPDTPLQLVDAIESNLPKLAIMMLPEAGKDGNIETLCLESALHKWPDIKDPLNIYINQSPAATWNISQISVAKMECLLGAVCKDKPEHSLHNIFYYDLSDKYVPLNHPCFEQIIQYLKTFSS